MKTGKRGEIIIRKSTILKARGDIKSIADELSNRKLSMNLSESQGDVAEELLAIGNCLQAFGEAFGLVADRCATVLANSVEETETMESTISAIFSSQE